MTNLNVIKHPEFGEIRTEIINNDVWFCGKDVCKVLGYERPSDALSLHCRDPYTVKRDVGVVTGYKKNGEPAIKQIPMIFINEGNLYRLILKSNMPKAEAFESWVCDEVLPQIRKRGYYVADISFGTKPVYKTPDVMRMLNTINRCLFFGDEESVARKLGTSTDIVVDVLSGNYYCPQILKALYERAVKNCKESRDGENFYLYPHKAIEGLMNPITNYE
jgi:prophage antirepressor-like protein